MTPTRPFVSIVTAVYNVEPYLPDFIASIEAQRFDLGRVEVIAVDDGSTDGSLALLEAWARRRPDLVSVLTKPNGGQGSARNLGLEHATGEWVTFTDPDDMLDREYLRVARRFADSHPDVEVMSGKPVLLDERTGRVTDTHPRRRQYAAGDRRVDLDDEPNTFTGSATVSLWKLDRIRDQGLRYDSRIQPNFEDGHFAVCYLLTLRRPVLGVLSGARYVYRKRAAGDSSLQRSLKHPGHYSDVLRFGYLDVIDRARARYGAIPAWLQHVLIYELSWYLSADEKLYSQVEIAPHMVPTFHAVLGQILGNLEPEVVRNHAVRSLKPVWADIFAHAYRPGDWHSPTAARTKVDTQMGLQRICYRFVGAPPQEEFLIGETPVQPAFRKIMSHSYYGRALIHERIAWLPLDGTLQVVLNGTPAGIQDGWPRPRGGVSPTSLRDRHGLRGRRTMMVLAEAAIRRGSTVLTRLAAVAMRRVARGWPYRSQFQDAWVLMDRVHNADDNAERLFEYLRAQRSDINAWFVTEAGTPDWERMRAAGVARLVRHGSFRWKMLMLNCRWLLSSHADVAIATPPALKWILKKPTWKFAFLQHGVIKDDLSVWLNRKDLDLFVVSTQAELASIVGDGTCYAATSKETRNTGLPRFDRLLAKGRGVAPDDRDIVLVAPTWRTWLTVPLARGSQRWAMSEGVRDSEYVQRWDAILRSPRIADAVERHGLRLAFMPHPNLQPLLAQMDLPPHVEPTTFTGPDVQELYARCALLVTDYSSVAFNVAYLDGAIVYYQFDRELVLGGAHLGRRGYFDYERDGFGPVVTGEEQAVDAIVATIARGPRPAAEYQARIDRTFPDRDGQACARVVAAVEELSRPYRPPTPGSTS